MRKHLSKPQISYDAPKANKKQHHFYFGTAFINCSNNRRVVTVKVLNYCYSETTANELLKAYLITPDQTHGPARTA